MNNELQEFSKKISLDVIYTVCEIKEQEAREEMEKALENKDLNKFTFQEGKLHCASQIKSYIKNFLEELCK